MRDKLFIWFQYIAPQHLISRLAGLFADRHWPWLTRAFTGWFIRRYRVDIAEAEQQDLRAFHTFNEFFTRALAPGVRTLNQSRHACLSPVDGTVSQAGKITGGRIIQAKGQDYSVSELLGGNDDLTAFFENGSFSTIYLSPRDYHRIHMPVSGQLENMVFVPGKLFSVNPVTARNVPRLFARNERVVTVFNTEHGRMAVVLVGAMVVASVETVWAGVVAPRKRSVQRMDYLNPQAVALAQGEEMGRFRLGSTVVLLFENPDFGWADNQAEGQPVSLWQDIGTFPES